MRHRLPPRTVEIASTALLLGIIALRTFGYPYPPDTSHDSGEFDGYAYYARHIDETGTLLPDFRRMPGYPYFLIVSSRLTGVHYNMAGQLAQGVLSLAVLLALVGPVRRRFGPLVLVILLVLLAAPNLWVRLVAVPFPDFVSAVISGVFALVVLRWTTLAGWRAHLTWGGAAVALAALLMLLKSGTVILIAQFGIAMMVAEFLTSRARSGLRSAAVRALTLIALAIVVQSAMFAICGDGALVFYRNAMHARIATYLPPASASEAEQIVEQTKSEIAAREGQLMEDENFTNTLAAAQAAVEAVWRDRLLARPFAYLRVMADEMRRKHYFVAASFTPFMADTLPNRARIPIRDGSLASRVYRLTGVYLQGIGVSTPATIAALVEAVCRTTLFWIPLLTGLLILWRRWPFEIASLVFTMALYVPSLAFGIFIDGRYLLPFAPLIYLAQAVSLAEGLRILAAARAAEPSAYSPS